MDVDMEHGHDLKKLGQLAKFWDIVQRGFPKTMTHGDQPVSASYCKAKQKLKSLNYLKLYSCGGCTPLLFIVSLKIKGKQRGYG